MKKITDVIVDEKVFPYNYVPCKERRIMFEAGNRACVACALPRKANDPIFDDLNETHHEVALMI